jgi:hypothetical protein
MERAKITIKVIIVAITTRIGRLGKKQMSSNNKIILNTIFSIPKNIYLYSLNTRRRGEVIFKVSASKQAKRRARRRRTLMLSQILFSTRKAAFSSNY